MASLLETGLPSKDSSSARDFFRSREDLIAKEKSQRSDHAFRQSLSPTAQRACEIVSSIRMQEHETIWSASQDSDLEKQELFPGMIFNLAKSHMPSTKLWRIVERMPKGALLHCHLAAMVDLEWVFNTAIETEGMCIISPIALTSDSIRRDAGIAIHFRKTSDENGLSIWDESYVPGTFVSLKNAADSFPAGGKAGFVTWLRERCEVTQEDSVSHHLGVDAIWRRLKVSFTLISSIVFYEPITRAFMQRFLQTAKADGIRWVEIRAMNRNFRRTGEDELRPDRVDEYVKVVDEEIKKFMASEEGKGFWGCRMIFDTLRTWDTETIIEHMETCIRIKKRFPHLVSGYDMVGPEDEGRTLHDLTPELLWFQDQCRREDVNIPFFFHAGETVGDGNSTDQNLFDAMLFGSRRIGHGVALYKHPLLIDMVKEKKVLIECCPISNEVLRYTASIMSHPLPALLARGVPASLSNDDPSLMGQGTAGMTHDFWQALQGWENLGLAGLGSLAQNSVRWAAFEDQDEQTWLNDIEAGAEGTGIRAERLRAWNEQWEVFCQWIVDEYGSP